MISLFQDVRYALRQLRKTPVFTVTVLLTLALGIGANAAIFTLVNSVLLSDLPVVDPATLLRVGDNTECCINGGTREDGEYALLSTKTYRYLRENLPEFADLAAMQSGFGYQSLIVRRNGTGFQARSVMGEFVSGNYFRTFGLKASAGRLLTYSDDVEGAPMTAVLSYSTWQNGYHGDPTVIGSSFWINTQPVTIVGVAPRGFFGDRLSSRPPEFYLPIETMATLANARYVHDPRTYWLYVIGRIKPGVSTVALQQKVNTVLRQSLSINSDFKGKDGERHLARAHATLVSGGAGIQAMREQYASHLRLLMWVAGLVLLIACANIANLLLVRGISRRTEMSVRTALGAPRSRIVRQLLTESLLLSALGGLFGIVIAYAGTRILLTLAFPGATHLTLNPSPSLPVIGFAVALALITGVLFGVAPAWMAAQAEPADALRSSSRAVTSGISRLQSSLVVFQVALSLVLLVGAALFAQSLSKLRNTDLKLNATNRYIVHINPQAAGYSTTQVEALYRTMQDRFHAIPGMVKVGIASYTPMENDNSSSGIQVQGEPYRKKSASFVKANAEYFDSVGTHVVMGRGIGPQDTSTAPAIAIVNQAFVKEFFDGRNPLGHRIGIPVSFSAGDFEIVGVVEDTAYTSIRWKNHSMYFVPMVQRPPSSKHPIEEDLDLYATAMVLETDHPMSDLESLTRSTLASINPNLTVVEFQTFQQQIGERFTEERMVARLTSIFGTLALLLAAIGLYGVTAYGVARRTSEIGVRMALGARRGDVVALIMCGAVMQTTLGLLIGVPVALLCVRFVRSQLYEITHANTAILALSVGVLALAACIAGIIPARRAATIDPVQALRTE